MYKKPLPAILLLTAALISCERGGGIDPGVWNAYRNPVEQSDVQDPCVIEEDGVFYLFSSELSSGSGADLVEEFIPTMTSPNLTYWTTGTSVFDDITKPKFIAGSKITCPDIAKVGGKYLLYYTLSTNTASGIGVAEAEFASGPFTDKGAIITSAGLGIQGVASPFFFSDDTDNWLVFGNFKGIYLQKLSADGLSATGATIQIASDEFTSPAILVKDGKYHLFLSSGNSAGGASSTSRIRYGRADRAAGPYLDRSLKDLLDNGGEVLMETSVKFAGPGNASLISLADGSDWLIYNAYDLSAISKGRTLMMDRIEWKDGWASVRGGIPSFSAEAPSISN